MSAKAKVVQSDDPWEDRIVGADEQFVAVAPDIGAELDLALDLHPISIRLQKNLIDNLKALAQINGLGYQPLIRQILTRWVDCELKQIAISKAHEMQKRALRDEGPSGPADDEPLPSGLTRRAA